MHAKIKKLVSDFAGDMHKKLRADKRFEKIRKDITMFKAHSSPSDIKPFHVGYECGELTCPVSNEETVLSLATPSGTGCEGPTC